MIYPFVFQISYITRNDSDMDAISRRCAEGLQIIEWYAVTGPRSQRTKKTSVPWRIWCIRLIAKQPTGIDWLAHRFNLDRMSTAMCTRCALPRLSGIWKQKKWHRRNPPCHRFSPASYAPCQLRYSFAHEKLKFSKSSRESFLIALFVETTETRVF